MKGKQTNKLDSFVNWRLAISKKLHEDGLKIRSFIWIQVNYTIDRNAKTCDVKSIIFEKNNVLNTGDKLIKQIREKFDLVNIPSYYLDFASLPSNKIEKILNLELLSSPKEQEYNSYWNYRLDTRPQNCLTCDIDAFEVGKNSFTLIEAAQLFNTDKNTQLHEVIKHIFRTFTKRVNKVNTFQYMVQAIIAQKLNSKSFILFHKINNDILDETSPALLLENNSEFHKILLYLENLKGYAINDEYKFIETYKSYFKENIVEYSNIQQLYQSLGIIYKNKVA